MPKAHSHEKEVRIPIASVDEMRAVFGNRDAHAQLIRETFGVRMVNRDGGLRLWGSPESVRRASELVEECLESARRGVVPTYDDVRCWIEQRAPASVSDSDSHFDEGGPEMASTPPTDNPPPRASGPSTRGEAVDPRAESPSRGPFLPRGVRPRSPGQAEYVEAMHNHDITFAVGPAGTGKTFLAAAYAVSDLKRGQYRRLILARPAVEAGERLGFLPGDFQAKINPYLRPLYDALFSLLDVSLVRRYTENDVIEIVPLAYMRGRTLDKAFIILDEAQNTTPKQMKMFLTRLGASSKIVVTGDDTQVDLPANQPSGLRHALNVLQGVSGISVVRLSEEDIVRHKLVASIVKAYERAEGGDERPSPREEPR